jgi:hypothetical protein
MAESLIAPDLLHQLESLASQEKRTVDDLLRDMLTQYVPPRQADLLRDEINAILESAEPVSLKAGTMDMDRLSRATHDMWAGLDESEITAIVQAMNKKL